MPGDVLELVEKKKTAHGIVTRLLSDIDKLLVANDPDSGDDVNNLLSRLVHAREQFNNLHQAIVQKLDNKSAELPDMIAQAEALRKSVEDVYSNAQVWMVKTQHTKSPKEKDANASVVVVVPDDERDMEELRSCEDDPSKFARIATRLIATLRLSAATSADSVKTLQQELQRKDQQRTDEAASLQDQIDTLEEDIRVRDEYEQQQAMNRQEGNVANQNIVLGHGQSNVPSSNVNGSQSGGTDGEPQSSNLVSQLLKQSNEMMKSVVRDGRRLQRAYYDQSEIPKSKLTMYCGDPLEYWPFMKAFDDLVGNSEARSCKKLNALINQCDDTVKKVIQSCQLMPPDAGYQKARILLKAKYGNPFYISQAWLSKMKAYPKLSTPALIEAFADDITCCMLTLSQMGYLSELQSTDNLTALAAKLPMYLRVKWRRVHRNAIQNGSSASLDEFVELIAHAASEATDPVYNDERLDKILEAQQSKASSRTGVHEGYRSGKGERLVEVCHIAEVQEAVPVTTDDDGFEAQIAIMLTEGTSGKCLKCQEDHYTSTCPTYLALPPRDRLKFARDRRLCLLCLSPGHFLQSCTMTWRCQVKDCRFRHHTSLHEAFSSYSRSQKAVNCIDQDEGDVVSHEGDPGDEVQVEVYNICGGQVASLPTAPITLYGPKGTLTTHCLLDSGSTTSLLTHDLSRELGLMVLGETSLNVNTVIGMQKIDGELVDLGVKGVDGDEVLPAFELVTVPALPISNRHLVDSDKVKGWDHLKDLELPKVDASQVGILIGQDNAHLLEPLDKIKGENITDPFAIRTPLGWTVFGLRTASSGSVREALTLYAQADSAFEESHLDQLLARQWRLEKVPDKVHVSPTDQAVLDRWKTSLYIENGKFHVDIPFKREPPNFPRMRNQALGRLRSLGKRLDRNRELYTKYVSCMNKYFDRGSVELAPEVARPGYECYSTHHAVEHPRKPGEVRMVINGSFEVQGVSLNKMVHRGPDQGNKLIKVVLNFRLSPVAFTADVEQMYYQVFVPPDQRDALRFLWYTDGDITKDVVECRMKTHIFGGGWSPAVATYIMRMCAEMFGQGFDEEIIATLKRFFYVDDCLRSLFTVLQTIKVVLGLRELLAKGGFKLTKFTSNSDEVLAVIPVEQRAVGFKDLNLDGGEEVVEFTLGSQWHPNPDVFRFTIAFRECPDTRRGMASSTQSIYDPMGLCAPVIINARRLGQILAKRQLKWDDKIPGDVLVQWKRWKEEVMALERFSVDRWVKFSGENQKAQLHFFSDASESAYGTVCYFCVIDVTGLIVHSTILITRCKLAPIKTQTIPRLELCAAQLSAALDKTVRSHLEVELMVSQFWTDSMLVLRYLSGHPSDFKTFMANRVADIQETTEINQWHYVPTEINPSDIISRGCSAEALVESELWKHGPGFLKLPRESWPAQPEFLKVTLPKDELKREKVVCAVSTDKKVVEEKITVDDIWERYSSWLGLLRGVAWLRRFIGFICSKDRKSVRSAEPLTADEISWAELAVVRKAQESISVRERNSEIFKKLCPVEICGVLCVGGRLDTSEFSHQFKHPYIFPACCHVTRLFIRHCHENVFHSGVDRTLMETRKTGWILGGRQPIRTQVHRCIICQKHKAKPQTQFMAELPAFRVKPGDPAFTVAGVDYFGPLSTKVGRSEVKRYVCTITCAVTRAVHLELAADLSTSAFLNAFNRFIARRGKPRKMVSDNGTNFVGARTELDRLVKVCNAPEVSNFFANRAIEWTFNPPGASHYGGFWERQNRTAQELLLVLTKGVVMSDDALTTFICQVEYCINSRPLTRLSDDAASMAPLTPNHFLILNAGEQLGGQFVERDMLQRRWRQTMRLLEKFWDTWTHNYLVALQKREKWLKETPQIKVDDLVLVVNEATPRMKWPLAIVEEVHPSKDGLVRTVGVRTQNGRYLRPITKLVRLEGDMNDNG